MLACKADKWLDIVVDLDSIEKVKDAGPKGEWSAYRTEHLEVGGQPCDLGEIPFWAMTPFFEWINELPKGKQKGIAVGEFRRTKEGTINVAEFRDA